MSQIPYVAVDSDFGKVVIDHAGRAGPVLAWTCTYERLLVAQVHRRSFDDRGRMIRWNWPNGARSHRWEEEKALDQERSEVLVHGLVGWLHGRLLRDELLVPVWKGVKVAGKKG